MSVTISWTFSGHEWNQQLEELREASWSSWAASVSFCLFQDPQCILQFEHLTHLLYSYLFTFLLPLDWAPGRQENVSCRAWLTYSPSTWPTAPIFLPLFSESNPSPLSLVQGFSCWGLGVCSRERFPLPYFQGAITTLQMPFSFY